MRSLSIDLAVNITAPERCAVAKLLLEAGFDPRKAELSLLAGDGSERRFYRAEHKQHSLVLILPNRSAEHGLAESRSTRLIGGHLRRSGVQVPEIFAYDSETGVIACEDLGAVLLHDEITIGVTDHGTSCPELANLQDCKRLQGGGDARHRPAMGTGVHEQADNTADSVPCDRLPAGEWPDERLIAVYEEAVVLLARMQVVGGKGFQAEWCWQTGIYDRRLMLSRESGYFLESFCRGLLGIDAPPGLAEEFVELAELASAAPAGFFLHRDFQSRNLMRHNGVLRVIDFQGGRFGPLGYDLASLLIDPYVSLSTQVQERLVQKYNEVLAGYPGGGAAFTIESYYLLSIQRNLQILGAFAFLSGVRRKPFFRAFLAPAALSLHRILQEPGGRRFPVLRAFAGELPGILDDRLQIDDFQSP